MNVAVLTHLGLAAYTAAAVGYLAWLVKPSPTAARVGFAGLATGFLFHGFAIAVKFVDLVEQGFAGPMRFVDGLSILAFLTVGSYLLLGERFRLPVLGAFVAPLVLSVLVPAHLAGDLRSNSSSPVFGYILPLHVGVALGGVALFAMGCLTAIMYLVMERQVKQKKLGAAFRRLPSLDLLDRLNYRVVVFGFVLLSITVATGALFSQQITGAVASAQPKQAFGLLAWSLAAAVVFLRQTIGWRGRKVAMATLAGFVLVASAYATVFAGGPA